MACTTESCSRCQSDIYLCGIHEQMTVCFTMKNVQSCKSLHKTVAALACMVMGHRHTFTISWIPLGRCPIFGNIPSCATLYIIEKVASPSHIGLAPNSSVKTAPRAYTSDAVLTSFPMSCSGDWNPGVPAWRVVAPNLREESSTLPSPKSQRYTFSV